MVALYYFLSRDEERRMIRQFGADYRQYRDRTGMFLPKGLEGLFLKIIILQRSGRFFDKRGIYVFEIGILICHGAYFPHSKPPVF